MKHKQPELDVDFIKGGRPLTKDDEIAISSYIRAYKEKHSRKPSATKRTIKTTRRKVVA
ncbi:MAG: hypothetical protein NT126_05065 [Bacteroidetes bacterium]|nr:hypothetical protein [Bacteroidota bacterium]